MDGCMFRRFSQAYSCSPSIALNLFTFFSLGILKVPWDSLVSISRLYVQKIQSSLFVLSLHSLELVHLLQLGDLEGSAGLTGLHFQVVDLHVPLLDLVLFVKLLTENHARFVIQLLAEGGKIVFAHGRDIRHGSNLFEDSFRNTHLG